MKHLQPLNVENAPEGSKETLRQIQKGYGFIPNLMATFAHSPAVLSGYLAMEGAWDKSSLSAKERQIILLTTSIENNCQYCKSAHSTILKNMMKVDPQLVDSIKTKKSVQDPKLNALIRLTRELVGERGKVSEHTKNQFFEAGYTQVQIMEVMVGIALKTLSNYIVQMNPVEIDAGFKAEA